MKRFFSRSVNGVKNGFRAIDFLWQKVNRAKDAFLLFLAGRYVPEFITPNCLSFLRIVFSSVIMVMFLSRRSDLRRWIVALFLASVLTDLFDGPIARARHLETPKGAFLDRLGDKLLICPLVAGFLWSYDHLLVEILVGSEVFSLVVAVLAIRRKISTKSNWTGKWKMFFQTIGVVILLFLPQQISVADKALWIAIGLGLASLISHFQSYVARVS